MNQLREFTSVLLNLTFGHLISGLIDGKSFIKLSKISKEVLIFCIG